VTRIHGPCKSASTVNAFDRPSDHRDGRGDRPSRGDIVNSAPRICDRCGSQRRRAERSGEATERSVLQRPRKPARMHDSRSWVGLLSHHAAVHQRTVGFVASSRRLSSVCSRSEREGKDRSLGTAQSSRFVCADVCRPSLTPFCCTSPSEAFVNPSCPRWRGWVSAISRSGDARTRYRCFDGFEDSTQIRIAPSDLDGGVRPTACSSFRLFGVVTTKGCL